jgi:DNA-binding NtrC family response regulator
MPVTYSPLPSVLIIDDDTNLLESYTVLLEDEFRVHTATTGEEGLACLQREAEIFTEVHKSLPGFRGDYRVIAS